MVVIPQSIVQSDTVSTKAYGCAFVHDIGCGHGQLSSKFGQHQAIGQTHGRNIGCSQGSGIGVTNCVSSHLLDFGHDAGLALDADFILQVNGDKKGQVLLYFN